MSRKKQAGSYYRQRASEPRRFWLYTNFLLALALIVAGVVALLWMGQQTTQKTANASDLTTQNQGHAAPGFTLQSLAGEPVSLNDYAGQVVLVNLWATWCPPCKAEMPALNAFYEAHQQDGFVVLAVNSQEEAATVKAFIEANGFTFPVLLDTHAEVMNQYHVRGLPTTFIIDRDGLIQHVQSGQITVEQLQKVVGPLL
jgi:cytochrome c biogenesis protein CcmG/thiol:disulfide interchange protein DsbE